MIISTHAFWYLFIGALLVSTALALPLLQRLWLTVPIFQMVCGWAISPGGLNFLDLRWQRDAHLLEVISEIAVIVSLYATGVKIRLPPLSRAGWREMEPWRTPIVLATATMVVTVLLAAAAGMWLLELPWAFALLLGAVMAPTDPVLADEVQIEHAADEDVLRRSLTGEAGLNDGTAFPFVLLAMGLIGSQYHELGEGLWRWLAIDLVYKIAAGLIVGAVAGWLIGKLAVRFCRELEWFVGMDELVTIGLIASVYGLALAIDCYAFLAVFAAAVQIRRFESDPTAEPPPRGRIPKPKVAGHEADEVPAEHEQGLSPDTEEPATALVQHQTRVGATLERIAQVFLVIVVGVLLHDVGWIEWETWAWTLAMLFVIRPLAVTLTLLPFGVDLRRRNLIAWFGIRGIGTIYYLTFALAGGVHEEPQQFVGPVITAATLTIAVSIVLHGVTVTPLMNWYQGEPLFDRRRSIADPAATEN